jgi:hypothetical protein
MTADPDSPRVLARLRTEADAQLLVDYLKSLGIHSILCGTALMSVRPEVPADVEVRVRQADLDRAQAARAELAATNSRVR